MRGVFYCELLQRSLAIPEQRHSNRALNLRARNRPFEDIPGCERLEFMRSDRREDHGEPLHQRLRLPVANFRPVSPPRRLDSYRLQHDLEAAPVRTLDLEQQHVPFGIRFVCSWIEYADFEHSVCEPRA